MCGFTSKPAATLLTPLQRTLFHHFYQFSLLLPPFTPQLLWRLFEGDLIRGSNLSAAAQTDHTCRYGLWVSLCVQSVVAKAAQPPPQSDVSRARVAAWPEGQTPAAWFPTAAALQDQKLQITLGLHLQLQVDFNI